MQEKELLGERERSADWGLEELDSSGEFSLLGAAPAVIQGIDASVYNTISDWNALRRGGWSFVILRAGLGQGVTDTTFEEKYHKAKEAGLAVGAYWFSYAATPQQGLAEAEAFLRALKGKSFEMPVYIDKEDASTFNPGGPVKKVVTEICMTFCERMEKAGAYVGVYANTNWFYNYIDIAQTSRYTRWLADYRQKYDTSIPRDIHQYGVRAGLPGIPGQIDCNNCFQDLPADIARKGKNRF